ncbi:MAG: hypothetical protein MJ199_01120 [Bacilli bacterium]|nr:hypothetical protein [Bacilli bacterium]
MKSGRGGILLYNKIVMKKTIYLLAPLMLVSCNGQAPSQDVKFLIQESSVTLNDRTIVIHLDWEPSSDIIEFSNFSFTLKNQSDITSTVTLKDVSARPLELTNTFNQALENDDIGELTFHYNDKTIKKEGEGKVENINIALSSYVEKPIKIVRVDPESYIYETLYEYDEKYRIINHTSNQYSPGGVLSYTATIQYTYNEHDDVVTYIESAFGIEYINLSYTHEYDGQGNMITQIEKGTDDGDPVNRKYTFAYDEYNRLLKENVYNIIESNNDELIKQYEYTYTEGKQYKDFETMKEKDGTGSLESQVTNTFDEKGRIIKVDDATRGITENTYDDYDCIIKQKITLSDGIEEATTTYYKNNPEKVLKSSVTTTIWYASAYTLDCEYDSHDRIKKETEINERYGTSVTTYYYELE